MRDWRWSPDAAAGACEEVTRGRALTTGSARWRPASGISLGKTTICPPCYWRGSPESEQNTRPVRRAGAFAHQSRFDVKAVAQKCPASCAKSKPSDASLSSRIVSLGLDQSPVGIFHRVVAFQFPNEENFHLGARREGTKQRVELRIGSADAGDLSTFEHVALHRVNGKVNVRLRLPDLVERLRQRDFIAGLRAVRPWGRLSNRCSLEGRS